MLTASLILTLLLQTQGGAAPQPPATPAPAAAVNEELWNAARDGDVARVTRALEKGADVNAKTRYGATALTFAADKGRIEVVKLLIERGADVNAQDSFYQMRALDMAMMNNHSDVALLLLDRGSKGVSHDWRESAGLYQLTERESRCELSDSQDRPGDGAWREHRGYP